MAHPIRQLPQVFAGDEIAVVTDDVVWEGEGDLIVAASPCSTDKMAFIIPHTCGIVWAPITTEDALRLRFDPMLALNESDHVGAHMLRDLGVTSIRHLTSSVQDHKGLSGFGIAIVCNEQLEG
jgi:3,4-dihydroxy-2-butanone 4-phosphate synthase